MTMRNGMCVWTYSPTFTHILLLSYYLPLVAVFDLLIHPVTRKYVPSVKTQRVIVRESGDSDKRNPFATVRGGYIQHSIS